ncbi:LysR family transcriptional regulator [Vibrio hyugaensis]|uniref:LysR family transcriptional regulator n=1 Tax=Vibrio hyugaensis TaxID=1534743 RepID=UPI0005EF069C|nr:LysR family transcriptional regulator [Vibrio hyugaensis]
MDTRNLLAFYTTANLGSISAAAKKLHVTQPAISKRIANLEVQLGCRLFDRIGRQLTLTQTGNLLLPKADTILRDVNSVVQLMNDVSGKVTGKLSIATSHHIGIHRLPPILKAFIQHYPLVEPDLHFMDSEQIYVEVSLGYHDFGLATLTETQATKLQTTPLWFDKLCLAVSIDHPLALLECISLDDLSDTLAILPTCGTSPYLSVKETFEKNGSYLVKYKSVHNLDAIKMMISIGLGWGVLPQSLLDDDLIEIQVENVEFDRELGLIFHQQRSLSNAAQAFITMLEETKCLSQSIEGIVKA